MNGTLTLGPETQIQKVYQEVAEFLRVVGEKSPPLQAFNIFCRLEPISTIVQINLDHGGPILMPESWQGRLPLGSILTLAIMQARLADVHAVYTMTVSGMTYAIKDAGTVLERQSGIRR